MRTFGAVAAILLALTGCSQFSPEYGMSETELTNNWLLASEHILGRSGYVSPFCTDFGNGRRCYINDNNWSHYFYFDGGKLVRVTTRSGRGVGPLVAGTIPPRASSKGTPQATNPRAAIKPPSSAPTIYEIAEARRQAERLEAAKVQEESRRKLAEARRQTEESEAARSQEEGRRKLAEARRQAEESEATRAQEESRHKLAEARRQAEESEAAREREENRRKELERRLAALERERAEAARIKEEKANLERVGTGTGFAVTLRGHVITNNHVVEDCTETRIRPFGMPSVAAPPLFVDSNNDLALLVALPPITETARFRSVAPTRQGDQTVVYGFPLTGALATQGNLTVGFISALAGLRDDIRIMQISAPVQPGNSGGPVLDMSGNVVGVVTSKIDAIKVAELIGDIPQNVNFAIKASVVRAFLDSHDVKYQTELSDRTLSAADVGDRAKRFTVLVECWK